MRLESSNPHITSGNLKAGSPMQLVDGTGFEPAASAPYFENQSDLVDSEVDEILEKFSEWLEVDELRKPRTIEHHTGWIRRLLKDVGRYPPKIEDYRSFLRKWKRNSGVYHYSNAIKAVRVFTRFLGCEQIGKSFKFPRIDRPIIVVKKKNELQKFYSKGLTNLGDKALFLVLATSGLRHHEATGLTLGDVNLKKNMIIPNNGRGTFRATKNTFVTFFNSEAKRVLKQFISLREIGEEEKIFRKGFGKSGVTYRWQKAAEKCGIKLKPSDLRDWFCNEMGKLGVADRYVDAFCGRVPRSILGRHYTDYSPEKLKEIYEKANLKLFH
jgi:integrase